jgi:hypothetical protein
MARRREYKNLGWAAGVPEAPVAASAVQAGLEAPEASVAGYPRSGSMAGSHFRDSADVAAVRSEAVAEEAVAVLDSSHLLRAKVVRS